MRAGVFYLAQYAVILIVASIPWRRDFIIRTVCIAVLVAVALQAVRPYAGGFGNPNFQAEFLCLALPFCVVGIDRCIMVALPALVGAVALLATSDSATVYGALAGFTGLYLAFKRRFWILSILLTIAAYVALFWHRELFGWSSIRERLELWWNTGLMWLDAPWFGHGIGSFNYTYYKYQEGHPWAETLLKETTVYAGAAHNEPMQVLATLGLAGAALALLVLRRILKTADPLVLSVAGVAMSLGMFGFPFQSAAPLTLIALGGSLALANQRGPIGIYGVLSCCWDALKRGPDVFPTGRHIKGVPAHIEGERGVKV